MKHKAALIGAGFNLFMVMVVLWLHWTGKAAAFLSTPVGVAVVCLCVASYFGLNAGRALRFAFTGERTW